MIAVMSALAACAKKAGINVPADPEAPYSAKDYPHWFVYSTMQFGAPMPYASAHWDNADAVAQVPMDQIMHVTPHDLVQTYGFAIGNSSLYA